MQKSFLLRFFLLTGVLAKSYAFEQINETNTDQQVTPIEVISIIANRQPRNISQVSGSVTIFDQATIQQNISLSIDDIVRYQPGVEVDSNSTRFGTNGFRIRGIGGNRTLTVIDNIPVSDNFSVGNYSNSGRGLIELNLVNNVEILRGPASTLYGSKALGGVVAVTLIDAEDLLYDADSNHRLSMAYNSDRNRFATTIGSAFSTNNSETLIALAYQQGHETEPAHVPNNIVLDAQDSSNSAILLRTSLISEYGQLRLTINRQTENRDTDIRAMLGAGRLRDTTKLLADDILTQERFVIDHRVENLSIINQGSWRLWFQQTETEQYTYEERLIAPSPIRLWRNFKFMHRSTGLAADFESSFTLSETKHRLGYGFEFINNRVSDLRNAEQTTLLSLETTNTLLGETFPLRDFPKSKVNEYGIYVHDEISLLHGRFIVSPGIRFEHYSLKPQADYLFDQAFPTAEKTSLSTNYWLPKLGMLYSITGNSEWFAQYAKGYRSPPFSDVNIGLYYPQFNIIAISNPDLKSEKGNTFETGLRWRGEDTQLSVSLFYNRYKDFIQSRAPIGIDLATGNLLFQSINRDQVVIKGSEIELQHFWTDSFSTNINVAWIQGKDNNTQQYLASVSPPSATVEFAYFAESSLWKTRLIGTFSQAQNNIQNNGAPLFSAPGYSRWDVLTQWNVSGNTNINLAIYNITNKNYWQNSNVLGFSEGDPTLPLLAEAGISGALSLHFSF